MVVWVTTTRGFSGMVFLGNLRGIQVEARKCQETPGPGPKHSKKHEGTNSRCGKTAKGSPAKRANNYATKKICSHKLNDILMFFHVST